MTALKELYLYGNRITNLVPNVFQDLTALKILSLGDNQITEINVNSFQGLAALEILNLSQNPLNCGNCEMLQLKSFLQNQTYGNAGAACNGTGIEVVDFDFTDCTATETNTLNTTKSNVGSTSEADNIAIITGTVTGAVVVLCVIAFFVMRKVCNYASNGKTVVHPSI
ncbi:protein slit-like [Mytilus trossulus]|uniref:protein slit-like n=1 Tax=Mytilus trossulus TaxID=6551 RepID=UPI003005CF32